MIIKAFNDFILDVEPYILVSSYLTVAEKVIIFLSKYARIGYPFRIARKELARLLEMLLRVIEKYLKAFR